MFYNDVNTHEGSVRAMEIISTIITNVLTALYQPFWFAVILSVLFMFVYKAYPSIIQAVWITPQNWSGFNTQNWTTYQAKMSKK